MIAFDVFYCIVILSAIAIIIYLYVKLKQPVINLINVIKSVYELLRKFVLIKQDLDNTINEINDAIIINKINSKRNIAKIKSNKQ